MQRLGDEAEQRLVGLAIDWRCGKTDFQRIAMPPGDFRFPGAGLDMQGQRVAAVADGAQPVAHRNISAIWRSRMATSGDRSMPEISGRMRRMGSSSGRVNWLAGAASGE